MNLRYKLLINDVDGIQKVIDVGPGGEFMPLEPERTLADERLHKSLDWADVESKVGGWTGANGALTFQKTAQDSNSLAKAAVVSEILSEKSKAVDRKARLLAAREKAPQTLEEMGALIQDLIEDKL